MTQKTIFKKEDKEKKDQEDKTKTKKTGQTSLTQSSGNQEGEEGQQKPTSSEEEKKKLNNLIRKSRVLLQISTVFPFDLFPDTIVIDENKVSILYKGAPFFGQVHSIIIKNIKNIEVDSGFIFAAIKITEDGYKDNPITIGHLKKSDAMKARRIIQGLIVCNEKKVDLAKIEDKHLTEKIEALGKAAEEIQVMK